ncbi:non-ribosomal peptide synthetase, partial [Edaphobacter dinghuensis]|uniref:non-ribosomal peptide synthetase n=1 Tax=Edaphobacter dinghuensis TaxID=1560005 RepID=UPI0021E0A28C
DRIVLDLDDPQPWLRHAEADPDPAALGLNSRHLAYVIYTSGSTGTPKGVMIEHRNLLNYFTWASNAYYGRNHGGSPVTLSFAFDASITVLFGPLLAGEPVTMLGAQTELIALEQAVSPYDVIKLTPGHLKIFNQSLAASDVPAPCRCMVLGGEALSASDVHFWLQRYPDVELINEYGPTEATIGCLNYVVDKPSVTLGVPIGRPIMNTQIYLLDSHGQPVPLGAVGEMYIGGAGVARGYLNQPELTAERFLPDPFCGERGARMYRTGDLARYLPDGNLEFLGRNDHQVKIRGFRIELGEIEARLAEHPLVESAVVVAREDTLGDKRLVAYYTTSSSQDITAEQLRTHLATLLPEYMVPTAFVHLEALPLTPNGKLDRKALPVPEGDAYATHAYEPPQGEIESALAQIWQELLHIDRVGRNDNFFELGGNSLLAMSLIERIRRSGFKIDIQTLFAAPTVAALGREVGIYSPTIEVPPNLIPPGCEVIVPELLPLVSLTQEEIDSIIQHVPGGARNIQDIYPLAPLQEGILFHHLMGLKGDPYVEAALFRLDGRARLEQFLSALQSVVDRNDILRTAIMWQDLSEPVQVVCRTAFLRAEIFEFDAIDGDISQQLYTRCDPRHFHMDVHCAPLLRAYFSFDPVQNRWLLMLLFHHLVIDHTTLEVILEEIQAYLLDRGDQLPDPIPFRNLVAHARQGVSEREHEDFFRQMLGDVNEPTIPFGLLDVQGDGGGIEESLYVLDTELSSRIRANARRLGVSAASLFHLAWARVLAEVCGRQDVVFGTVLFGRMRGTEWANRGVGLFLNTLPIRMHIDGKGVEDAIQHIHYLLVSLMRHEHASLALAQRCSAVSAPAPLFSTLLNYRYGWLERHASPEGIRAWEGIDVIRAEERTNYPVTLSVNDLGDGFSLHAQTSASIQPLHLCQLMNRALEELIEALYSEPSRPLHTLDVLPASERNCVLYEWNDTKVKFPSDKCVHQLFEEQVVRTPHAVALVYEDDSISYTELNRRANRLAHYLRKIGVRPDDRVAICTERGFEMIIGLMAVLKAGGAYVPLDPAYPIERLRFMLKDSTPLALLTQGHLRQLCQELQSNLPILDLTETAPQWSGHSDTNPGPEAVNLTPHHLAYIIYTSGSTGKPKGVMVEHVNLHNYLNWAINAYIPFKNSIVSSSLSFDATITTLLVPLLQGGEVELLPEGEEIDGLYIRIRENITKKQQLIKITPSHLDELGRRMLSESLGIFSHLFVIGGEALLSSTVQLWHRIRPDITMINEYGPTETVVGCVTYNIPYKDNYVDPIAIGRPIANTRIYILDEYRKPVPIGVAGEMYIGGAGVARGYLNRPELTAERFLADPFRVEPEARMYRTGDLARYLPDGNLEFLGRNDQQVKIRGFRIELGEIEVCMAEHPLVEQAVVIAREDVPGNKRLVAYYTTSSSDGITAEQLRTHLASLLQEYMVPAAFVHLEVLPLTPNGKLDRTALPAPDSEAYASRSYESPYGETEIALAKIWSELLHIDRIGRNDNFFHLGGHSLLAVRLLSRLGQRFHAQFPLSALFASPTLAQMGDVIIERCSHSTPDQLPPIEPHSPDKHPPLSYAQQRLWFLSQLEGVSAIYHIPAAFRLRGHLDTNALRSSLDTIFTRHASLRSIFLTVGGRPDVGFLPEGMGFPFLDFDLRNVPDGKQQLEGLFREQTGTPFDLSVGPLLRACLVRLGDEEHVLILVQHHIVSDGWSMGLLVNELSILYSAYLRGEPNPLPPLEIQYPDYAAWQRKWLAGERLEAQADYWKRTLADAPPLLDLPTDRPRPAQQSFAGALVPVRIDAELTRELKAFSEKHNVTLFMTLLAAWAAVLSRLSGQDDVVIGTPVANRRHVQVESLIGFFVNTLALRIDLGGEPTVEELLRRIRTTTLDAQDHQDLPFEQVVEIVNPPRRLDSTPLFQVMFVWQNEQHNPPALAELQVESFGISHTNARFDLELALSENHGEVVGSLTYSTALFDEATATRYAGYLARILAGISKDSKRLIGAVNLLAQDERKLLLETWNATEAPYPENLCIHQLFEEQVRKNPEAKALIFKDESLSYAELNRQANRLAHYLIGLGIWPDDRVAICVDRGPAMVVGLLAILKAGGAYVPLDPAYPSGRLTQVLHDAAPRVLFCDTRGREVLRTEAIQDLIVLDLDNPSAWSARLETDPHVQDLTSRHLAYVIYTSGSTGTPKGVMIEHRNTVNLLSWAAKAFTRIETGETLFSTSIQFDLSVFECFLPLMHGSAVHLTANAFSLLSDRSLSISLINTVPSAIKSLLDAQALPHSVLTVNLAGEPLRLSLIKLLFDQSQVYRICNLYGPTETTTYSTWISLKGKPNRESIGRPIMNTRIYLLDSHEQPVPFGAVGEMYIGGAGVARGYLNQPELTAERFLPDPFCGERGARMYRTGDMARYLPDGNLEFLGRNDHQVKIRGFRIELGEIEARLAEHPLVESAVVGAREDTLGDKRLVAYYTGDPSLTAAQLRSHLAALLPEYMVPSA